MALGHEEAAREEAVARRRSLRAVGRVARLVLGEDVDPAIRGLLAAFFCSTLAFSAFWNFAGIWAIRELGASSRAVGLTFLGNATAAALFGYLGGHHSDRVGRKPLMLLSWSGQAVLALAFVAVGSSHVLLGLGLIVLSAAVSGPGQAAGTAIVADLVPRERQEAAYATTRVAFNLGVVVGPPFAGLLLLGQDWSRFFAGVAVLGAVTVAIGARFVPARGAHAPDEPPQRGSFGVIRRDRIFLGLLVSTVLAYVVYYGFETALPIAATDSYGVAPSTWGFLLVLNAAAVALFQLRLTRAVARFPAPAKLAVAMPLMGFPFLLLLLSHGLPAIVVVLVVFVVGEMLWVPVSQAIAAAAAPADLRGAYMGAFGTSGAVAFALGPLAALQLRGAAGNSAMWLFLAGVSVVGAAVGAVAAARALRARGPLESPSVP